MTWHPATAPLREQGASEKLGVITKPPSRSVVDLEQPSRSALIWSSVAPEIWMHVLKLELKGPSLVVSVIVQEAVLDAEPGPVPPVTLPEHPASKTVSVMDRFISAS